MYFFHAEGYPSTYGRASVVRAAEAYISTVWRHKTDLFTIKYYCNLASLCVTNGATTLSSYLGEIPEGETSQLYGNVQIPLALATTYNKCHI